MMSMSQRCSREEKDRRVTLDDTGGRRTLNDALKVSVVALMVIALLLLMNQILIIGLRIAVYLLILNKLLLLFALVERQESLAESSENTDASKLKRKTCWECFCLRIKVHTFNLKEHICLLQENKVKFSFSTDENTPQSTRKNDHPGDESDHSDDQCSYLPSKLPPPGTKVPLVESSLMPDDLDGARQLTASAVNDVNPNKLATIASLVAEFGVGENEGDRIRCQNTPETFGKDPSAMPTRILNNIKNASKAVGYLVCGNYKATCWLLAENIIITCKHVFLEIDEFRNGKTNSTLYENIYVNFEYEWPGELQLKRREIDLGRSPVCFGKADGLDYIIHHLKPIPQESSTKIKQPTPLRLQTRSRIPPKGQVILVGHPDGLDKRFEVCTIVPKENRNESICERVGEAVKCCQSDPSRCRYKIGPFVSCVHDYSDGILTDNHYRELAYHTSFYEGSSGSPVLNDDGHIIAMHTGGYKYKKGSKKESLMEFGLPIRTIYEDVVAQLGQENATWLFPSIFNFY
ncbi:uncharacterized protein LOC114528633 isoform X2 [Dendronephthya gigantea]|uniref:uncharacterized protein LOC114528633 isoform X2 n=1 Tax=Dendronephthya gigantea TaxID=151771 RepID=UPI00106B535C|nr:uncharacterized protein LOC114528633 isoform X2 [Dendronephthya gigantea]